MFNREQLNTIDRYSIRRRLGAGGMGVVYEAFDKEREQVIALKTLRWADAAAVYRFKREFRSLTNVRHPNLVSLYELAAHGDEWFFTMERVDGVDFLQYVNPSHERAARVSAQDKHPKGKSDPAALRRLRRGLKQLAQGLYALHRAGKVHQDIKPTNVLVTPEHRVVILDFGLTADSGLADPLEVTADAMWGTAGYMAPEYGNGPPGPAADWFAVGTMMYEALTGEPPYRGGPSTMLRSKWKTDATRPQPPSQLIDGVPEDLEALCMALLDHDPNKRPSGRDVLERLNTARTSHGALLAPIKADTSVFVGRADELRELQTAYQTVQTGRPAVVLVKGSSGIGKSALISHFLRNLGSRGDAIVLSGRCYPREAVPDKALDSIVDNLGAYLRRMPASDVTQLVPENVNALLHLFSILRQVPAFATEVSDLGPPAGHQLDIKRRGYEALSELLRRLGSVQPVIVHVDDLQWADEESVRGLCDVLGHLHPPPVGFIASFRDGWSGEPLITARLEGSVASLRTLQLGPFDQSTALELISGLASEEVGSSTRFASEICDETDGNPFLIEQIVRHMTTIQEGPPTVTLEEIVKTRLVRLGKPARSLMEAICVAGHPIGARTVHRAAKLKGDERDLATSLEIARLVRVDESEQLIPFHDRIRQAVVSTLPKKDMRQLRLRIAHALRDETDASPELLFEHFLAAEDYERAGEYAVIAARAAADSLSFERAIQLYGWALKLEKPDPQRAYQLHSELASALSGAGRLAQAAEAFLSAATLIDGSAAIESRRLGAEHLLLSGRIEDGLQQISTVLDASRLSLATSTRTALLSLVLSRLRLRLHMAIHPVRSRTRIPTRPRTSPDVDLHRVDVCRSVAEGLAHLDYIHAADFQARHARLALKTGDPDRVARALAIEAGFAVLHGGKLGSRRGERLLRRAESIAARAESSHALALCTLMSGTIAYFRGEWVKARVATSRAQNQLRQLGSGVAWEAMTSQLYHTLSLFYAGDLRALVIEGGQFLKDAEERGNRFASTIVQTGPANAIWLVRDDTPGARQALQDALDAWPERPFRTPHYLAVTADARIGLYEGDGERALDVVSQNWGNLRSTGLLRIQVIRVIMWHLRATCLLAAANGRKDRIQQALRDAARIHGEKRQWCHGLALIIEAEAAALTDRSSCPGLLREAMVTLEGADMRLHAQAARRQLGLILGGDEGGTHVADADDWMSAQGVWSPERMAGMIFPKVP